MVKAKRSAPSIGRPYSIKNTLKEATAIPGTKPLAPSAIFSALINPTANIVTKTQPKTGKVIRASMTEIPTELGINFGDSQKSAAMTKNLAASLKVGVKKSGLTSSAKPSAQQTKMAHHRYKKASSLTGPGV